MSSSQRVVVAGPDKRLLDTEIAMIADYLAGAGRLLVMQDPGDEPGLEEVLAGFGVGVRNDVVVDKISQLFGGDALVPLVPADGYDATHKITKNFTYQTFYPMARSIEVLDETPDGASVTSIARTSEYSWGERSDEEIEAGTIQLDEGIDAAGPLTLGAAITRSVEKENPDDLEKAGGEAEGGMIAGKEQRSDGETADGETTDGDAAGGPAPSPLEARLLLFGDSDFASNAYFNASGNGDLILNGIAWLAERGELVSIRPRSMKSSMVILTPAQESFYGWTILVMAPLAITVVGVGIWARRRRL